MPIADRGTVTRMFGVRPSRFGSGGDPWFRLGTAEVGSSAAAALAVVAGMVLWAVEGSRSTVSDWLVYSSPKVMEGQLWRLFTWFVPNSPSLWTLFGAFVLFALGSQIEEASGRVRMAQFIAVVAAIPALVALVLYAIAVPGAPVVFSGASLLTGSIFLAFVAHRPTARFFFGIPGWVLAAIYVALELLVVLGTRDGGGLIFLLGRLGGLALAVKAFGLADPLGFVPRVGRRSRPVATTGGTVRSPGASVVQLDERRFAELELDAILDQISERGTDSLSVEQRRRLEAYSKKSKRRRGL